MLLWLRYQTIFQRVLALTPGDVGIEKVPQSDWIQMDWGYLDRLNERVPVMEENPQWAIGVNEISAPAILKLFKEVMIDHVPKHFPSMFRLDGDILTNLITQQTFDWSALAKIPTWHCARSAVTSRRTFILCVPMGKATGDGKDTFRAFPAGLTGHLEWACRSGHSPARAVL